MPFVYFTRYYGDQMNRNYMDGYVARMGDMRNVYIILVGKSEGKGPLGRPKIRWESKIGTYLREVGWEDVDWMHLVQDRDQW
jgi:hypothetical protein